MSRNRLLLLALVSLAFTGTPLAAQAPPVAAAQAALAAEDPDEALRLLKPHLRKNPRDAAGLFARSTANCMLGDLDGCKKDLDEALRLDPTLRQAWLNRSAIAIAESRFDDALAALTEAERLDPGADDNAVNQGAVELLRGNLEAATAQFRRHLARTPDASEAWYLVASNYAHAGYAALALEHLQRAIQLEERARVRARSDANFAALAGNRAFQRLMLTDDFTPPPGSGSAARSFETLYAGSESPIFIAILNAVQLAGMPLDPRVEITPDWALLWSTYRIKIERNDDSTTTVRLHAAPGSWFPATWESKTAAFFAEIEGQLLKLELAADRDQMEP